MGQFCPGGLLRGAVSSCPLVPLAVSGPVLCGSLHQCIPSGGHLLLRVSANQIQVSLYCPAGVRLGYRVMFRSPPRLSGHG